MAQQSEPKPVEPDGQSASGVVMASSGSDAADKDVSLAMAATYGTRSRNRGGNARPNYAEDKDIEMDVYDYYQEKKDGEAPSKKSSRQASVNGNVDAARGPAVSRKPSADEAKAASSLNGHREQSTSGAGAGGAGGTGTGTGGTGAPPPPQPTPAAPSASQPSSRKRKAAAAAATTSTSASAKKAGGAAVQTQTQTSSSVWPDSNMLTFDNCDSRPRNGQMVADDGTVLEANDHVYLVCEPPGEPYYLGRIMEFLHAQNDSSRPVDGVRINWYYRPKDIGRKTHDTRLVFATMHSDISPLTALRGKCQIRHRVEIPSMEDYRKTPDSFWYEKLYDRYIQKNYDLIATSTIVNVPEKVKKVLDDRWKYVLVEQGRGKELTSAVKLCKRCTGYCASNDSVDCAVCRRTYHMNCVKPPLLKKPSRGFAWSCAACSRAQERKLEARHTSSATTDANGDVEEDEFEDEEDMQGIETDRTSPADDDAHHEGTAEQIYQASLWPYRYLGMHCKPEDALDYDDRIYPRASTRIGPRHQAPVGPWPGQPVQYVKPLETKKIGKKEPKLSKEAQAAQEAEKILRGKRPKWIQDQPSGYVARGGDHDELNPECTATLLWKPPPPGVISNDEIVAYKEDAQAMAKKLNVPPRSTNLQDAAIETLLRADYDAADALHALSNIDKHSLKEPSLLPAEIKKFEDGISKYGSELHLVMKHVKTMTPGEVVRFYYTWKKTERGQQIWGNYAGRKGKKQAKRVEAAASKFADDVADNEDDSAFDTGKAMEKKRGFLCQFCSTTTSRQWRRAPNATPGLVDETGAKTGSKDKNGQYVVALCRRCAELWRRYAVRWEDEDEVAKKVAQAGGRAWKRRQDEELLKELQAAQELGLMPSDRASTPPSGHVPSIAQEPPRKKLKGAPEKDTEPAVSDGGNASSHTTSKKKDKVSEKTPIPEMPKPKTLPCAVCDQMEPLGDQHLSCRECRLTIHRNCYGVVDHRIQGKWICDMCTNDKSPQVSIQYKCVLCPVDHTEQDFVEQPKLTHHKKKMSEKDRERERMEVQQARKAADFYRKRQEELNRPANPREPLKRTADNNWVHVTCAVWTPEVKFANAKAMEPSEGIPSIPRSKYDEICQACNQKGGACVSCHQCRIPFHVECARQQGHVLGFDISPVKSSRRDQFSIVSLNGESGTMSAAIWCKDHVPTKTIVHRMHDVVDEQGQNALQLYVQNFKQADLTLTGTVRKANLMRAAAKMSGTSSAQVASIRRISTTTTANGSWAQGDHAEAAVDARQPGDKVCITCGIDVTPKWWPIDNLQERRLTNGHYGTIGSEAQKFVEQRKFQCHKCRKTDRTPKPHTSRPPSAVPEAPRLPAPEPTAAAPTPPLRSPPAPMPDYRDGRHRGHAWPQHPGPQVSASPQVQPPAQQPIQTQAHQGHVMPAARPAPVQHPYTPGPPPRAAAYSEWVPHRPGSQHGSPPRHLNGGPPPLHNGPPMSNLSSLRPPSMSGPPMGAPIPVGHQHAHSPPAYANGMPPSPRRMNGPTPPASYMPAYHGGPVHAAPPLSLPHGPPPHNAGHSLPHNGPPHGMSNGVPPPRHDPFAPHPPHSLHINRPPPFAAPQHGSPPVSRNGYPPGYETPGSGGLAAPRGVDGRPASGASASPSLRNLLS